VQLEESGQRMLAAALRADVADGGERVAEGDTRAVLARERPVAPPNTPDATQPG
jgi:hypothetical protein